MFEICFCCLPPKTRQTEHERSLSSIEHGQDGVPNAARKPQVRELSLEPGKDKQDVKRFKKKKKKTAYVGSINLHTNKAVFKS